jgi:hypothetical protein
LGILNILCFSKNADKGKVVGLKVGAFMEGGIVYTNFTPFKNRIK